MIELKAWFSLPIVPLLVILPAVMVPSVPAAFIVAPLLLVSVPLVFTFPEITKLLIICPDVDVILPIISPEFNKNISSVSISPLISPFTLLTILFAFIVVLVIVPSLPKLEVLISP